MSYKAIITEITHLRPHSNADRIKLATVHGFQIIVGLDVKEGDLGIFFPTEGQLSEAFANANDLVGYTDPETGEKKGGFFAANRRVKSQRFRGEKSEGFWIPVNSLKFTGYDISKLKNGDILDELGGVSICTKYYSTRARSLRDKKAKTPQREVNMCKHVETEQFRFYVDKIPTMTGAILTLTEKVHGTSGRFGHVLETRTVPVPTWKKILTFGRAKPTEVREYRYVLGTRNTILKDHTHVGYYGSEEFRWNSIQSVEGCLHKGEVIYYEIIGWVSESTPIMPFHRVDKKNLPEIRKQYGDLMRYSYGCAEGNCDVFVYRITMINEEGVSYDLTWPQVKARASELGLKTVPEIPTQFSVTTGKGLPVEIIRQEVEQHISGPSLIDPRHIREGVVVRVDFSNRTPLFLKAKSEEFGILEGYLGDNQDFVDPEDIA